MKKKPPVVRFPPEKSVAQPDDRSWHNGGGIEIGFYARSLQKAAKNLIEILDLEPTPKTAWDAAPVIQLYKQSVELHLKFLVGEGGNFVQSPPDHITLYKTHSLRWLTQIVCQIVKKVRWEKKFKCEGVASLADFSAVVAELEALDPVSVALRSGNRRRDGWVPSQFQTPNVVRLAKRLDGLLNLLDATADELAAMWDQASGEEKLHAGDDFGPTIQ
jgi:hypothetical protein